jgi:hypothetical protein
LFSCYILICPLCASALQFCHAPISGLFFLLEGCA